MTSVGSTVVLTPEDEMIMKNASKMILEENRLNSFKDWVYTEDTNCSASKLAEAGFYFVGNKEEPDAVECFLCGKSLDGWEESDDPWSEHLKHASYCNFAKLRLPEAQLTLHQLFEFLTDVSKKCLDKILSEKESYLINKQKELRRALVALRK